MAFHELNQAQYFNKWVFNFQLIILYNARGTPSICNRSGKKRCLLKPVVYSTKQSGNGQITINTYNVGHLFKTRLTRARVWGAGGGGIAPLELLNPLLNNEYIQLHTHTVKDGSL